MYGNGCVSECLDNAIVVRRFWTVEKPGELLKMLEYVLNTFTNVFCQYCPRSLGEKASDVEQSWHASAKLPARRPSPHWTVRGPVKEGIMFGELSVLLFVFLFLF